ncbi:hypothetical protein BDN72DRAFT_841358, partial [Pluteus cervinus]
MFYSCFLSSLNRGCSDMIARGWTANSTLAAGAKSVLFKIPDLVKLELSTFERPFPGTPKLGPRMLTTIRQLVYIRYGPRALRRCRVQRTRTMHEVSGRDPERLICSKKKRSTTFRPLYTHPFIKPVPSTFFGRDMREALMIQSLDDDIRLCFVSSKCPTCVPVVCPIDH